MTSLLNKLCRDNPTNKRGEIVSNIPILPKLVSHKRLTTLSFKTVEDKISERKSSLHDITYNGFYPGPEAVALEYK